jgi:acetylglutamate kinase
VNKLIAKAEVLLEALPYMQRFAGRTIVIKYGGSAMLDERLKLGFAQDVVLLNSLGLHPVIVHGGGPQIGKTLARLGIETRFVRGLRVTDEATMEVVEMVLGKASKMKVRAKGDDGKTALLDIGLVGKVDEVRPQIVERLRESNFIPVIAPIGADARGNTYNINADTAASKIAQALGAEKLILLTDVKGILDKSGVLQPFLSIRSAKSQVRGGSIADGMVPKVECAIEALQNGVKQVHIIDGRVSHAVLLEIFTRKGVGTEVVQSERRPRARRPAAGAPVGKAGAA